MKGKPVCRPNFPAEQLSTWQGMAGPLLEKWALVKSCQKDGWSNCPSSDIWYSPFQNSCPFPQHSLSSSYICLLFWVTQDIFPFLLFIDVLTMHPLILCLPPPSCAAGHQVRLAQLQQRSFSFLVCFICLFQEAAEIYSWLSWVFPFSSFWFSFI